jgi:hypothetical protein
MNLSGNAGAPAEPCPATVPMNGAVCNVSYQCTYLDCDGAGQTSAFCNGTTVSTEVLPCAATACGASECAPSSICVEHRGGMATECVANPCGDGAITCGCVADLCDLTETCSVNGTTVRCEE